MRRLLLVGCATLWGCDAPSISKLVKADLIFSAFNTPAEVVDAGRPLDCTRLTGSVLRDSVAQIYDTPGALRPLEGHRHEVAEKLAVATECVAAVQVNGGDENDCFAALFGEGDAGVGLALPFPPAPRFDEPDAGAWKVERDVERVQVGLTRAVRTMANTCQVTKGLDAVTPAQLREAWTSGLKRTFDYQEQRPLTVRPEGKSVNAWVFAGGAANGAFSAGAAWWALSLRERCLESSAACAQDQVQLLGGASTGTLIAVLVKNYFSPGASAADRAGAMKLLTDEYTCAANAELYCTQDMTLYDIAFNPAPTYQGLVRFDGVEALLTKHVGDLAHVRQSPEQFASTVDFQSGQVYQLSSAEYFNDDSWRHALLASIVEPLLAEPVHRIGTRKGTWIDGGVRSGLPLLAPLRRGADRAVVFVNSPLQGSPKVVRNAGQVGLRAIDLFSLQPILGELAQAEAEEALRRQAEKDRCLARLRFDTAGAQAVDVEHRCSSATAAPRSATPPPAGPQPQLVRAGLGPPVTEPATGPSERIRDGYQSTWLFEPNSLRPAWSPVLFPAPGHATVEWDELASAGYTFDPNQMWNLFALGALTAQQHCAELKATLGWHVECPSGEQAVEAALLTLRADFVKKGCGAKSLAMRACPCDGTRGR